MTELLERPKEMSFEDYRKLRAENKKLLKRKLNGEHVCISKVDGDKKFVPNINKKIKLWNYK